MKAQAYFTKGQNSTIILAEVDGRLWKAFEGSSVFGEVISVEINGKRKYHQKPEEIMAQIEHNQPLDAMKIEGVSPYTIYADKNIESEDSLKKEVACFLEKMEQYHELTEEMKSSGMMKRSITGGWDVHSYIKSNYDVLVRDIAEGKDCSNWINWAKDKCQKLKASGKTPNFSVCTISWI